jgi:hypothetical protein
MYMVSERSGVPEPKFAERMWTSEGQDLICGVIVAAASRFQNFKNGYLLIRAECPPTRSIFIVFNLTSDSVRRLATPNCPE